jgi:hypothetical protein
MENITVGCEVEVSKSGDIGRVVQIDATRPDGDTVLVSGGDWDAWFSPAALEPAEVRPGYDRCKTCGLWAEDETDAPFCQCSDE